jgi:hypothetical protein
MKTYTDNTGTIASTSHGQAPACPQPVTIHNNGQSRPGFWNGSNFVG